MTAPFSTRIFVPSGNPDELRVIDRQSSSAKFLVFPRIYWPNARDRKELKRVGIYILSGYAEDSEDDKPTIYVGQTDRIVKRLKEHMAKKDFWDMAVVFTADTDKLNSAHAKWLENELITQLVKTGRSILDNTNIPKEPNISEAEKAELQTFLTEIYQTLPLVGINSFDMPRKVEAAVGTQVGGDSRDTIVVPAREEGFNSVFLGENVWYAIRISGGILSSIKYIAAYQVAPVCGINYYAKIDHIESYGDDGKYKLIFAGNAIKLRTKIVSDLPPGCMQGSRYTSFDKLKTAKKMSELF